MRVLGEAEGVERAGEGSLQVAKHRVHGQEVRILDAGRSTASDVWLVQDACVLEDSEAAQAVGDHRRWGNQGLGRELFDRRFGERPLRKASQYRQLKLTLPTPRHRGGQVQQGLSDANQRRAFDQHCLGVR